MWTRLNVNPNDVFILILLIKFLPKMLSEVGKAKHTATLKLQSPTQSFGQCFTAPHTVGVHSVDRAYGETLSTSSLVTSMFASDYCLLSVVRSTEY